MIRKEQFGYLTFDNTILKVKIHEQLPEGNIHCIDNQPFRYRLPTLSAPLKLFIEITNKCNLHCVFCSSNSGGVQNETLSIQQIESLLLEACEMGIFEIGLIGGEPLCHPDFFHIVKMIKKNNLSIHLNTNGFFNDETLYKLSRAEVERIIISIDGLKNCHEAIRGSNTFEKTVANAKYLISEGNNVQINSTVNKNNYIDIKGMIELSAELGCNLKIAPMILIGRSKNMPEALISIDDWELFYKDISNFLEEFKPKNRVEIASGFITDSCEEVINRYCFLYSDCGLRGSFLGVNCFGEVFNTGKQTEFDIEHKVGEITKNSLQEIWKATEKKNIDHFEKCTLCKDKDIKALYHKSFTFN